MPLTRIITAAVLAVGTPAVAYGGLALAGPSGNGGSGAAASTTTTVEEDATGAQAFVDCMRDHGLADFPDATLVDGRLVLEGDASGLDPFSDTYQAAVTACEGQLPEGTELPAEPEPPSPPPTPEDGDMPPSAPTAPPAPELPD